MGVERLGILVLALGCLGLGSLCGIASASDPEPRSPASSAIGTSVDGEKLSVDLQGRIMDLEVVERDGVLCVRPQKGADFVPATAWLQALRDAQSDQRTRGLIYVILNITTPWSLAWIAVGFAGQALFTLRMLLQWYASEKEKRSVIPVAFWWSSLFAGVLLFAYFVWRKDIVGIVGQSTGIFVYARNLVLIHRASAVPA